jgi:MoxR-like ATPase
MKNYHLRPAEKLALKALQKRKNSLKCLLIEGPPGVGKTYFAESLAKEYKAEYLYYLCHHWTSDEELFVAVNVGRVAAGVNKPEDAYEYGVLTKAAIASQSGGVVLCLDEVDKAPQRTEALLLDFLQHGRIYLPDGKVIQGKVPNITVVMTTNAMRPLMEATLRRGFRLKMEFLPPNVEADIIRKSTGAPMGPIRVVVRMACIIRTGGATAPSLQEMRQLVEDLSVCESADDVQILIQGWLCKEPEDWEALVSEMGRSPHSILWGEYKR